MRSLRPLLPIGLLLTVGVASGFVALNQLQDEFVVGSCELASEGDLLTGMAMPGDAGGEVRFGVECSTAGQFRLTTRLTGSAELAEQIEVEVTLAGQTLYHGPLAGLNVVQPLSTGVSEIVVSAVLSRDATAVGEIGLDLVGSVSGY